MVARLVAGREAGALVAHCWSYLSALRRCSLRSYRVDCDRAGLANLSMMKPSALCIRFLPHAVDARSQLSPHRLPNLYASVICAICFRILRRRDAFFRTFSEAYARYARRQSGPNLCLSVDLTLSPAALEPRIQYLLVEMAEPHAEAYVWLTTHMCFSSWQAHRCWPSFPCKIFSTRARRRAPSTPPPTRSTSRSLVFHFATRNLGFA